MLLTEEEAKKRERYYPGTDERWRESWSYGWRHDLFLLRMADIRGVSAEWLAEQAQRLTGNLRGCMRDAEPCNDFTVHWSWPWPVVKILAGRGLIYPDTSEEWSRALTGRGWGVRLLMQGAEHFTYGREPTHKHWEMWWPPAEMHNLASVPQS